MLSWDRSALTSTGLKIDGDLAVIDVDVSEADLVDRAGGRPRPALPRAVRARPGAPRRRRQGSLDRARRRAVPAARLAALVSRQRSGRSRGAEASWSNASARSGRGSSRSTGRTARERRGEVISRYQFAGGASPATVPRASLPVLPKAAYAQACDLFDEIAAAAGLTAVKDAGRGRDGAHVLRARRRHRRSRRATTAR